MPAQACTHTKMASSGIILASVMHAWLAHGNCATAVARSAPG